MKTTLLLIIVAVVFAGSTSTHAKEVDVRGDYGGVGMVLDVQNNMLTIAALIGGTPSADAGILAGDRIIEIEGKSTQGITLQDAVDKIRGNVGTVVNLTLTQMRRGFVKKVRISLKRVIIKAKTKPFVNTLGMKFLPVPGTTVLFSIWETRAQDYHAFSHRLSAKSRHRLKNHGHVTRTFGTYPVCAVSWENAKAFCAWLTKKELAAGKLKAGQRYRLPTDSEWSMAVGLGKELGDSPAEKHLCITDVYPWGVRWRPPIGAGNYRSDLGIDNFNSHSPVGIFSPNYLGLYDLGGNVKEWCEDWHQPAKKRFRVLRGASYRLRMEHMLLSSRRSAGRPQRHGAEIGFRCVLTIGVEQTEK